MLRKFYSNNQLPSDRGFTLIEIVAAVGIMGAALGTLIVLHTRMLDTFQRERNLVRASLAAQYIMTVLQTEKAPPEASSENGDLVTKLDELGYFEGEAMDEVKKDLNGWTYSRSVSQIDIYDIKDILRRVDLYIGWGERESDRLNLVLFFRSPLVSQPLPTT